MRKIYSSFLILVVTELPLLALAPASSTLSGNDIAGSDLLGIFDGKGTKIETGSLISIYPVAIPQSIPAVTNSKNNRKKLYQILAEQEDGGANKFYTLQEIQNMLREDYGTPPTTKDSEQIQQALNILKDTKFGAKMCSSISYGCSIESIKKAGIELRVKKITYGNDRPADGETPPPVNYSGRIFVGLKLGITGSGSNAPPQALALTILHEMSHVEDLKQNKLGTLAKALYASEEKAILTQLAAYDEISRQYPAFSADLFTFLVDMWKWKNENGPYPRQLFLKLPIGEDGANIDVSSGDLEKNYMPGLSFLDGLKGLVHAIWKSAYGNPSVNETLVNAIRQSTAKTAAAYRSWRENPQGIPTTVPITPQQPPHQQQPTDDDDDGHTGHGNSGHENPGNGFSGGQYNPNFGNGI